MKIVHGVRWKGLFELCDLMFSVQQQNDTISYLSRLLELTSLRSMVGRVETALPKKFSSYDPNHWKYSNT